MSSTVVLYAPNVHTGGGFVLLRALLEAWPTDKPLVALLDQRAQARLKPPARARVHWVAATPSSRLKAEFTLRTESTTGTTVLCFHGLPPLLPSRGRVVVFQQNRLLLGEGSLARFTWKTRLRLGFERAIGRGLRWRVSEYVVQTPGMERALVQWYGRTGRGPIVRMLPFADRLPSPSTAAVPPRWDFVYVSDGEAHKNHRRLLEAWQILAAGGLRPSLALTLGPRDRRLADDIEHISKACGLEIHNLGHLDHEAVLSLYQQARALVYPSTTESFGLPLIEATAAGLPILAGELDYVRDVCAPVQTFDPSSAVSMARAVQRFMGPAPRQLDVASPGQFWHRLLDTMPP